MKFLKNVCLGKLAHFYSSGTFFKRSIEVLLIVFSFSAPKKRGDYGETMWN